MGDIGDPIDTTIPDVGAFGTEYAQDINDILEEVVARLTAPVPVSSIENDDQGTLDMNNGAFTNAQYVSFYEQGTQPDGAPAGRIVYFAGNVWFVTASGAIQVTDGTGLNTTVNGGIGGDYGGINPALVSFVDASETYEFYDNASAGEWAIIKARQLDLVDEASGRTLHVKPSASIAATWTLTLPVNDPASGVSIATVDATGQLKYAEDATVTQGFTISDDITLSGTTKINHGTRTLVYSPVVAVKTGTGTGIATLVPLADGWGVDAGSTNNFVSFSATGLQSNWRLLRMLVVVTRSGAGTLTQRVTIDDQILGTNISTDTDTHNSTGSRIQLAVSLNTPYTLTGSESVVLFVQVPNVHDYIHQITLEYDVVA
jgi:hypothetical protein